MNNILALKRGRGIFIEKPDSAHNAIGHILIIFQIYPQNPLFSYCA